MSFNKDSCLRLLYKCCSQKKHSNLGQHGLAGQTPAAVGARPVLVALLALMLGACASPPAPPSATLGFAVPARWAGVDAPATADPLALAHWWMRFEDLLLGQLVSQALAANPGIQAAQAALRQAWALHDVAVAGLWPALGASASAQRSRNDNRSGNSFQVGLDASWELDVFGAQRNVVHASAASAQASAAGLGTVQVSLAAEVALNYIALRSAQQRLGIARANLASQRETLQLTQWRWQAGLATSLEAEQASAAVEQTAAQVPALQTSITQASHALAVLTGQPPPALAQLLAAGGPLPQAPSRLTLAFPAETLRQRSDVQVAQFQLSAAAARLAQADAQRLPNVRLGGSLGLGALTLGALTDSASVAAAVLASVSWPLLDGGAAQAQVRAQRAAFDQVRATYQTTVLAALQEVEDALVALRQDRQRLLRLQNAFASADIAATLASQRYSSGLVDFQVVLETQRSRLALQDSVASAAATISADHVRLYQALGGGWQPRQDAESS